MANPLLAMLKSATGPPPQSDSSTPSASAAATTSPAPAPAGYQPVSLDDLFKSINGPPKPAHTAQQATHEPPPHLAPVNHQAKLLGMLSSSNTTPELSRPSSGPVNNEQHRRASLLNALKSPVGAAAPLAEPIIHHPGPEPVVSPTPAAAPVDHKPTSATPPSDSAAPTPNKSIFDFVSPFDAFEAPKAAAAGPPSASSSAAGAGPARPVSSSSGVPSVRAPSSAAGITPVRTPSIHTPAPPSPVKSEAPAPKGRQVTSPPAAAAVPRQVKAVRSDSRPNSVSPPVAGRKQPQVPLWPLSEISKNNEGKGPKSLPPGDWTVDLSQPNLDSLVDSPDAVRITPITMLKAEAGGFRRGRAVAHTDAWIAYPLPRGRVRLIAKESGARTVLQLASTEPIVDISATDNAVATVSADGSVNAHAVPAYWDIDDPPCPLVFTLPAESDPDAEKPLGQLNQVEWVRRDGVTGDWLAIGGTHGAVIARTSEWGADKPEVDARHLFTTHKVLKTSGVVVQFCLNDSHQAIGLISSSGYFCLYSVASLNKVWQRQLPSTNTAMPLSSARFCEAHILVGRGNDTMFDLVQITTELAVITTLKLTAPGAPSTYAHAEYDSASETLFIAPFDRGSIYALHYALKGLPPLRNLTGPDAVEVRAFDAVAEYVLAPVTSMSIGNWNGAAQIAFSTPSGISQAVFEQGALPASSRAEERKPERKAKKAEVAAAAPAPAATPVAAAAQNPRSPQKRAAVPSAEGQKKDTRSEVPLSKETPRSAASPAAHGSSQDIHRPMKDSDIHRALKDSEARLTAQFRDAVGQSPRNTGADLSSSVSDAVSAHLKRTLPAIIQQELKSILPKTVQGEIRTTMSEHVPAAIHQSLGNVGRDVESAIAPIVPRTLTALVQPAIERAVQQSIAQTVVPALNAATNRVYDALSADLKAEMVQIRKDLASEQETALDTTNSLLSDMAENISSLQAQLAAMSVSASASAARSPAPAPAPASAPGSATAPTSAGHHPRAPSHLGPTPSQLSRSMYSPPQSGLAFSSMANAPVHNAPAPANANRGFPAPPRLPNPQALEHTFHAALEKNTTQATLQLVREYAPYEGELFQRRPVRSMLSAPILLTLLHRLSGALNDLSVQDPLLNVVARWMEMTIANLDARDPAIASYFPRVAGIAGPAMRGKLNELPAPGGPGGMDVRLMSTAQSLEAGLADLSRKS